MQSDEHYLRRAIRLAMNGRGLVEPNPMVGCVIVKDGRVIGEGFHQKFGQPHAEPNALAACNDSPEGATAYVTLEPCCHIDKKTPPCVPRLIAAKIARVVIGCLDPNPAVNGNGVRQLREAGIAVDGPLLEAECKQLIAAFIKSTEMLWPYVTLKWAETADGKVAGPHGHRSQISNERSTKLVHLLRSRSDLICVGINTVLTDDPMLTPRGVTILRPLRRIVLDSDLRIPLNSKLISTVADAPTTVLCFTRESDSPKAHQLRALGVTVTDLDPRELTTLKPDRRLSLTELLIGFEESNLLVESGPTLARGFFDQNAADRLWVIRSPRIIGDDTAPSAAKIPDHFIETGRLDLDGDVLTEYISTKGNAFFALVASADFVLAQSEPGHVGTERPDQGDAPLL